jgi:drug/metabolite transporter (DMT)-like permease
MLWLFFALLSPLFFAIVYVLDSYCVEKVFDRPWIGLITSSLASSIALLIVPIVTPHTVWNTPRWEIIPLALLAGTLIQLFQAFYFQSLAYSEAGIVAAHLNLIPVILPVVSYFLFGQAFGPWTYVGIALNIAASVSMCLLDSNFQARWKSFLMMLAGCFLYAAGVLVEKYIFDRIPVLEGFLLITAGIVVSGSLPLALPRVRLVFRKNMAALRPAIAILVGIEVVNLLAIYFRHRALSLGDPSLIEAVATIQPGYTFGLSFLLYVIAPRFGDAQAKEKLWLKLLLVGAMIGGVRLVSWE